MKSNLNTIWRNLNIILRAVGNHWRTLNHLQDVWLWNIMNWSKQRQVKHSGLGFLTLVKIVFLVSLMDETVLRITLAYTADCVWTLMIDTFEISVHMPRDLCLNSSNHHGDLTTLTKVKKILSSSVIPRALSTDSVRIIMQILAPLGIYSVGGCETSKH